MMEPSAYGSAVLFGPNTWNFDEIVSDLKQHRACLVIQDQETLQATVSKILTDKELRHQMGKEAANYVLSKRGATQQTISQLEQMLNIPSQTISSKAA